MNGSIQPPRSEITARTHKGLETVAVSTIHYFKAEDKYVIAHHDGGSLILSETLLALCEEFGADFLACHRSVLVAKTRVLRLVRESAHAHLFSIVLTGEVKLPASRRMLRNIRDFIAASAS